MIFFNVICHHQNLLEGNYYLDYEDAGLFSYVCVENITVYEKKTKNNIGINFICVINPRKKIFQNTDETSLTYKERQYQVP